MSKNKTFNKPDMSTAKSKPVYPEGFGWKKKKIADTKPRNLTRCPQCNKKMIILREDDKWIHEKCSYCPLTRKRRK